MIPYLTASTTIHYLKMINYLTTSTTIPYLTTSTIFPYLTASTTIHYLITIPYLTTSTTIPNLTTCTHNDAKSHNVHNGPKSHNVHNNSLFSHTKSTTTLSLFLLTQEIISTGSPQLSLSPTIHSAQLTWESLFFSPLSNIRRTSRAIVA